MEKEKGKIYYRNRAKQIIDYSGLCFGNCSPTDVDGLLDYKNQCSILLEYKLGNKELPKGQRLALERSADNSKIPAVVIVATHDVADSNVDIPADSCPVREMYFGGKWYKCAWTVRETVERFLDKYGNGGAEMNDSIRIIHKGEEKSISKERAFDFFSILFPEGIILDYTPDGKYLTMAVPERRSVEDGKQDDENS